MPRKLVRPSESSASNTATSQEAPQMPQMPPQLDLNSLMASAQNIVKSITSEDKNKIEKMDMSQMFEHVTDTVFSSLEKNGNQIDPASKQQMKVMTKMLAGTVMENMEPERNPNVKSKIDLGDGDDQDHDHDHDDHTHDKVPQKKEVFEELDSDTEVDELRPIAEDLYYKLPVSLEEIYTGKTKKLLVSRERLDKSGKKVVPEKRKIEVPVLPGMRHGQEIRFNKEGNEKYGYRSGDIIITLAVNSHSSYERVDNALCCVKNISLYESYAAAKGLINIVIKHLDGTYMILKVDDGVPLHAKDGTRKVRHGGMPVFNKKTRKTEYGDLYIRFNLILPETFDGDENLVMIEKLFPVLVTNKDAIIYNIPKRHSDFDRTTVKAKEVLLEEVTPEDLDQLDYDDEPSKSSSSGSGSESESGSE
jgi:DnaJ-class molecular chaperone